VEGSHGREIQFTLIFEPGTSVLANPQSEIRTPQFPPLARAHKLDDASFSSPAMMR
jgi:hypothetical protein